ncbi:MAG TPA: AsmA-like C-terminal region-containing protein [Pirellulales bacterium]|nr:AsmA-like C-terminal region-containing protein [Pirellulales bacterium]
MLALVGGVATVPFLLYHRVDEEIRARFESKLAEHYPNLIIRVRYAQLVAGEGIEVRGLSISERSAEGPQPELAYFDEIFFTCQTTVQELLSGDPLVTHVLVRRPVLRMTRRPDGSWSAAKLLPLPKHAHVHPEMKIENGTIEVFDPLKNPSTTLSLRDIHLTLKPLAPRDASDVEPMSVEGYLAADQIQRVEVSGKLDRRAPQWSLAGTIDGLQISPELRLALPGEFARQLEVLGSLRCEAKLDFRVNHQPARTPATMFAARADVARGRTDDARLPFSLSDVQAHVEMNNDGFELSNASARNGQTTLEVLRCRGGYARNHPLYLEVVGKRISLDHNLVRVLPESLRKQWYKYLPEGEIDVDLLRMAYDGQRWTPDVSINCLNVSFLCDKFPYRLDRATGHLRFNDQKLTAELTAYSGARPIRLNADVAHPGPNFTGWIEARGDNIPLDEKLLAALNDINRPVLRSLNPQGSFNFFMRSWRDDPTRPELHQHLRVSVNRCAINYEHFPYPLSNICGTLEMTDGQWTVGHSDSGGQELRGTNDTGFVTCNGSFGPAAGGKRLHLVFTGENVPLEEELRDALPPNMGRLWNSLKPRGAADLNVELTYESQTRRMNVRLRAKPRAEISSIEPIHFPYRLEKFSGTIHYEDGKTRLENVTARHGQTAISTEGTCDIAPDGAFRLHLVNLAIDRFLADHELVGALPEGLRRIVAELRPSGQINMHGNVEFSKGAAADAPLKTKWDGSIIAHQAALDTGCKLENVFGRLDMAGGFDGQQFHSRGELDLDSATFKNFSFNEIKGPLWVDNHSILLGIAADTRAGNPKPRRLEAKIFGGQVQTDLQVALGSLPQYDLRATLDGADLGQFAMEYVGGKQKLNGKVVASVALTGSPRNRDTLKGAGSIRLSEADIYELPIMVSLLKILSGRVPDTSAFTKSNVDFHIQGEHVLLDQVTLSGDAVSLYGQGQLNFDRQINLTFHSLGGSDDYRPVMIRKLLGGASQQLMQIHVEGTLDHPVMRSEAFPMVNQALHQWQQERQRALESANNPAPPLPPATVPQVGSRPTANPAPQ